MRIIAKQMEVKPGDGFANDAFGRSDFAKTLTNLTRQTSDGLVIALDAKWGEGKTTFVKMWQGMLKDNGIPSIYIDAFRDDYINDAFLNIATHITQFAEENVDPEKAKEFTEKAAKVVIKILSWGAKAAVKAASGGLIDAAGVESIQAIKEDITSSASEATEKIVKDKLSSGREDTTLVESFHNTLSSLPSKMRDNDGSRLVVIVDELDRCRPTYAVDMLERIKHLFSVPNITFVLVINKEQLEGALKSVYGQNLDARTYLQKFVTLEVSLPKNHANPHRQSDLRVYAHRLYTAHELDAGAAMNTLLDSSASFAQAFDLSLRQLERVFTNIAIFYSMTTPGQYRPSSPICFLSVLKVMEVDIFNKLSASKESYTWAMEMLNRKYNLSNRSQYDIQLKNSLDLVFFSLASESEYSTIGIGVDTRNHQQNLLLYFNDRTEIAAYLFEIMGLVST